jgi:murein L,D-transpeptidase YafK
MNRAIQVVILLIVFVSSALPTQQKATRVLVLKNGHTMELFSGETVIKAYTVALGRGGLAPKQRQGDHLTPEGLYQIDHRNKNSRFYRALHVSYPNEVDRERARKLDIDPGGDYGRSIVMDSRM